MNPVRILAAATIIAAGFTQPVFAQEADPGARQVLVRHTDLDLTQEDDARRMLDRINRAARRNCDAPKRNYGGRQSSRECREQAVAAAVRKVDAPMLTAIYSGGQEKVLASK